MPVVATMSARFSMASPASSRLDCTKKRMDSVKGNEGRVRMGGRTPSVAGITSSAWEAPAPRGANPSIGWTGPSTGGCAIGERGARSAPSTPSYTPGRYLIEAGSTGMIAAGRRRYTASQVRDVLRFVSGFGVIGANLAVLPCNAFAVLNLGRNKGPALYRPKGKGATAEWDLVPGVWRQLQNLNAVKQYSR
ncbi:hypothetical protein KC359_g196 [Hortaea werneckii]|nr:hypothetical protein KC359_g196 [Hortaea werneckii]